jgi:hypothetical protein
MRRGVGVSRAESRRVTGLFGAGSMMIAFGAVLGRTTISQLLLMTFLGVSVERIMQPWGEVWLM